MEIQSHGNILLVFYHFITMPFSKNSTPPPPHLRNITQSQVNINININVNIILFQKERYFNLFVSTAAYIYMSQFEFRGIKRCE